MDELQALIKELRELVAVLRPLANAQATGIVSPSTAATQEIYPKVVEFEGVKFNLFRPINPKWKPSQYAKMFGKNGKQILDDPSLVTTPDGHPSRSAAGYPLTYPFVKDGVPYKPAVILFADQTFNTDEEVEAYIKATTPSAEDIERARKEWEEYDRKLKERAAQNHPSSTPTESSTGSYEV